MDNLKWLKRLSVTSLIILAAVAFALGFYPLQESAVRAGIGAPILLPVLVDLGLVLMGLGAMAARANGLSHWPMRLMAIFLILVSAAVQYFHSMEQPGVTPIDVVIAVLPPLVLWASSSAVETLIFGKSVQDAVAKADQTAARAAARIEARKQIKLNPPSEKQSTKATPKGVAQPRQPQAPQNAFAAAKANTTVATSTPKHQSSGSNLSEKELQEAIALVRAGEPLATTAKQFGIARSTLGRKVEAFTKNSE